MSNVGIAMIRPIVLVSYVLFILGTGPLAGMLYGACWPACSSPMGNEATLNNGACMDGGDNCCFETARLASLPAKLPLGHPAFHGALTWGPGLDTTPSTDHGNDTFLAAYLLEVRRPPSHLVPLRI